MELAHAWWLFVPRGRYPVGARPAERAWVAAQFPELVSQLTWAPAHEVTLDDDAPYFREGQPPTEQALNDATLRDGSRFGALWAMPHFCRDGALWTRRGGPSLAWPFQEPSELALTIPSLVYDAFEPDTCLLRPCRWVSAVRAQTDGSRSRTSGAVREGAA